MREVFIHVYTVQNVDDEVQNRTARRRRRIEKPELSIVQCSIQRSLYRAPVFLQVYQGYNRTYAFNVQINTIIMEAQMDYALQPIDCVYPHLSHKMYATQALTRHP